MPNPQYRHDPRRQQATQQFQAPATAPPPDPDGVIRDALAAAGQPLDGPIRYGEIQRYGRKAVYWLIAYRFSNGHAWAVFGDWRQETRHEVCTSTDDHGRPLNGGDAATIQRELEQQQREREQHQKKRSVQAAKQAALIVEHCSMEGDSAYLERKQVQAHGLRFGADEHGPFAAVPMVDLTSDALRSVQLIRPDGSKRFLLGTPIKGNALCHLIGASLDDLDDGEVWIAEGYATAATVHEATGQPVLVAFDSGNLPRVAKGARERWPAIRLAIAADNDQWKVGQPVDPGKPDGKKKINRGVTAAHKAAKATGARVAIPDFSNLIDAEQCRADGDGPTDFNDLAGLVSADVVRHQLTVTLKTRGTPGTRGTARNDAASSGTPETSAEGTEGTVTDKPPVKRPGFATHDDRTGYGPPGLYWHGIKTQGDKTDEVDDWIASPIHAEAITASERETEIGLLLKFRNPFGRWVQWAAPMRLLKGSGEELRGELLDLGMQIDPRNRNLLNQWMMSRLSRIKARMLAATRTGWHRDGHVFVLPGRNIGAEADGVVFQSEHATHDEFTQAGTLAGWQTEIGRRCHGNPMLILPVSAALAGPLLGRVGRSGAGLHFDGDSSLGKTTALRAAASVWGGEGFIRTWRATANGLEGVAAALNDTTLILDEIGEADPRDIGAIVYAIGNGIGKARATRTGAARSVYRWRVVLLSSGERTLEATLAEGGRRIKAGQTVRMLDIPCQRRHGIFDALHDQPDGRALSDTLRAAALRHHGHVGPAFVEGLAADDRDFGAQLAQLIGLPAFESGDELEGRAAATFAAVAMAGELGIEYGLLPWQQGEALDAAVLAFDAWRHRRGRGQTETCQILQAIEDFIDRHGDSRFSDKLAGESPLIRDRAGWWRDEEHGRIHYLTAAGLREATTGFDFTRALDALEGAGWLVERGRDKRATQIKVAGRKRAVYAIRPPEEADE